MALREVPAELQEPKKPPSGFWLWLTENRESLRTQAATNKAHVVAQLAGEKWASIAEQDKKPWYARADQAKEEYVKAMDAFKASGGVPGARRREKASVKASATKEKHVSKKARKAAEEASGKPKRPQTAYFLWLSENRQQLAEQSGMPTTPIGPFAKYCGEKWKSSPDEVRKAYDDKVAASMVVYEREMEAWRRKQSGEPLIASNVVVNDLMVSDADGSGDE